MEIHHKTGNPLWTFLSLMQVDLPYPSHQECGTDRRVVPGALA